MAYGEQLIPSTNRRFRRSRSSPSIPSINAILGSSGQPPSSSGYSAPTSILNTPSYQRRSVLPTFLHELAPSAPKPEIRKKNELDARKKRPSPKTKSLLEELDRPFKPGETITPKQTALLAEAFGLPGITYAKAIVPGESGYQPGIRNPDDATPSLFQITPSVQSAATQAKFDRIASKHPGGYSNPIAAAKQAAFLAKGSPDEGVSNYVAYNPSAPQGHLPGGREQARKILGLPAKGGTGRKPLSIAELYHDPGINISDGQETGPIGGHPTHVHFASENPRDVLRAALMAERRGLNVSENPAFDPVDPVHTGGSHHYQVDEIPENLRRLARRAGATGAELGEAIDVNTGTPEQLLAYNQALARRGGGADFADTGGGVLSSFGGGGAPLLGGGTSGSALSPARSMKRGAGGQRQRNPLAASAPLPSNEEEQDLASLLGDRYRPQRRVALDRPVEEDDEELLARLLAAL